jgi:ubiquinone/menaquinone biosynthesis C-methylase UbiE
LELNYKNKNVQVEQKEKEFYDNYWKNFEIKKITGRLEIPEVSNLKGSKILICSCGSGIDTVYAANAGADVYAFDISSTAVEMARVVAKNNNVNINAEVMDFHSLKYENDTFDYIYGTDILHHIDCDRAGKELFRCLKPGGVAFFWENSDRNPILRFFRRMLFGKPGGYQKNKFLFFRRDGTTDEYPLTEDEVKILSDIFEGHLKRIYRVFYFFQLLSRFGWKNKFYNKFLFNFDKFIAKIFPFMMKYSFEQGIWMQKIITKKNIINKNN